MRSTNYGGYPRGLTLTAGTYKVSRKVGTLIYKVGEFKTKDAALHAREYAYSLLDEEFISKFPKQGKPASIPRKERAPPEVIESPVAVLLSSWNKAVALGVRDEN